MNNKEDSLISFTNSLIDIFNDILPKKEDIEKIENKIKNNEELDSYEKLVIEKIKIINNFCSKRLK